MRQAYEREFHRADKVGEELAHVKRELAEAKGEDAVEETSETLAIYESFKAALEPFGHTNINVRGRIEMLVREWKDGVCLGGACLVAREKKGD